MTNVQHTQPALVVVNGIIMTKDYFVNFYLLQDDPLEFTMFKYATQKEQDLYNAKSIQKVNTKLSTKAKLAFSSIFAFATLITTILKLS